ncbi:YceI family protein [Flavobacterium sp.]|uniref:YceI family protein n=1 Tax=Flavobacterium sp. TaxID=239 RepID=UPI002607D609|nr:YceI family protein [Flavobacterium sp.]
MKKCILCLFTLLTVHVMISQKMMTRSGEIKFEASMPALEEIAATNNSVSCIFDKSTGEFVTLALVKGFRFKVPLMEEHFNENYVESSLYPKSTFKGKIVNYDAAKLAVGKSTFDIEGELTLHGVTKKVKAKITFTPSGDKLLANSAFAIKPVDYKIDIPSVVKNKIAEDVKISLSFALEAK